MFIVDTALKRREAERNPIRVGMVGAGFMARGIANQIANSVPGMELVAIALELFSPPECLNFVRHCGYRVPTAL